MVTNGAGEGQLSAPGGAHVRPDLAEIRAGLAEVEVRVRRLVRRQPVASLLVAAGLGFVAARLVRRLTR